jgi:hypothetical protein
MGGSPPIGIDTLRFVVRIERGGLILKGAIGLL